MNINQFQELQDKAIEKDIAILRIDTFAGVDKIYYKDGTTEPEEIDIGNGYSIMGQKHVTKCIAVPKYIDNKEILSRIVNRTIRGKYITLLD